MAEFQEVCKQWERMCSTINCCNCAINDYCDPYAPKEAKIVEEAVMAWVAEHPEPQYPTWGEWFVSMYMLPDKWDSLPSTNLYVGWLPDLMHTPITADIAVKLGIEPKEG